MSSFSENLLDSITTPTLLLDEEIARRNLKQMAQKIRLAGVRFRPHFKTHQSAVIGEWFRAEGVTAITVSSVEMAEYFAAAGWTDILIAFSLNLRQLERVVRLAEKVQLGVLVEDADTVRKLGKEALSQMDVWIKVDVGSHRTGLNWEDVESIREVQETVLRCPHLHLNGLLTHSGATYHCETPEEVVQVFREGVERLNELRAELESGDVRLKISVGDTPGCSLSPDFSGIDELRPGNFLFYDAQQLLIGSCTAEQIAVAVACPVVAVHPQRNEVVVYGGAIHLSKDWVDLQQGMSFGLAALDVGGHWGSPIPEAIVRSVSQEHGVIRFGGGLPEGVKPGDLLYILPAHSCLTVQEQKNYLTLQGEVISTMNS
ncbi:MAG: alanine racemase [Anaerolineaceae bacterium]|nr:alanine racemase [Anaerolineaceae bacterium]